MNCIKYTVHALWLPSNQKKNQTARGVVVSVGWGKEYGWQWSAKHWGAQPTL